MTPINLRLNLTPDVLARLTTAVADKFRHFVRIKDTKNAGQVYEVNLSILDLYHTGTIDMVTPVNQVTVTREMVDELFDLLGLFPRSVPSLDQCRVDLKSLVTSIKNSVGAIQGLQNMTTCDSILAGCVRIEEFLAEK